MGSNPEEFSDSGATTPDEPVNSGDRIVALDFIRGIAVLGILFANIVAFSAPLGAYSWPGAFPQPMDPADNAVWLLQYLVIDGKMRGLFTLLFGVGMVVFIDRAWASGQTRWLQARRLLWLMAFGLLHFFFLFWGDILFLYSIAGLAALLFVRWDGERMLKVGVTWYVVTSLALAGMMGAPVYLEAHPTMAKADYSDTYESMTKGVAKELKEAKEELAVYREGSYTDEVVYTAREHGSILLNYPPFALFETLPLMLIGMGLYRLGMFSGEFNPGRQRKWGWIGIIISLVLTLPFGLWAIAYGYPYYLTEWVFNALQLIRLPFILGLAALLSLMAPKAIRGWLGSRLVAAGRMAFSNYIGTSVLMMLVFRSWSLGLFGELDRLQLVGVVLFGWAMMLAWSKPWLARFRYGPLEWLWRCLTYWKLFPLKR